MALSSITLETLPHTSNRANRLFSPVICRLRLNFCTTYRMQKLVNLVSSFNDIMNVKVAVCAWVGKESKLHIKEVNINETILHFWPLPLLEMLQFKHWWHYKWFGKSWAHHTENNWCWCAINGLKLLLCIICYHYVKFTHIHTHLSSGSARVDTDVTLSPSIAKHYGVEIPPTLMEWKQGRM